MLATYTLTKLELLAESVLATVSNVEEAVLVLVLLIDCGHCCTSGRQNVLDKDEDGLLWAQLDALADDIDELADSEVCGHKVLLLVDFGDV